MRIFIVLGVILFIAYYLRRYWLTPWARFVSLTSTKRGDWFLTVRHVKWYPPFSNYDVTYHSRNGGYWSDNDTGHIPWTRKRQSELECIRQAQVAREVQINELMEDVCQ